MSHSQMDIFSPCSDPHPFGSTEMPESTSSLSDAAGTSARRAVDHNDEEVLLASSMRKRRAGRKKFKETRHPVYRGVRRKNKNNWVCEMRKPNEKTRIWLGTYPTAEMAARAHDVAALALRGSSACLNFADSAWRLPVPASTDAGEIRKAAVEAAEEFRPSDEFGEEIRGVEESDHDVFYMDEEAVFDMPGLLVNMAEGLLMSPPHWDDMESNIASLMVLMYRKLVSVSFISHAFIQNWRSSTCKHHHKLKSLPEQRNHESSVVDLLRRL